MSKIMDFVVKHAVREQNIVATGPVHISTLICTFKGKKYFEHCTCVISPMADLADIDDMLYNRNLQEIVNQITLDEQDRETESYIDFLERQAK